MTKLATLQTPPYSSVAQNQPSEGGTPLAKRVWELVPEGEYIGTFKSFEEKKSSAGNLYLSARFEVEAGEKREKRSVFAKFMLEHPNPKTVDGATKKLMAMAKILGAKQQLEDTSELNAFIDKKCILRISIKPGTPPYSDYNEISRFISY